MKININSIQSFYNKLKNNNFINNVSDYNIKSIIKLIQLIGSPNLKHLKKICLKSQNIINTLNNNFNLFNNSFLTYQNKTLTTYTNVRNELHHIPSYDNENSILANKIKKCTIKKKYILTIDNFNVNLFFYCSNDNIDDDFVYNTARIIFIFIKTFSRNNDLYKDFNFRFLLVEHPRVLNTTIEQSAIDGDFNNSSGMTNIFGKELIVTRLSGFNGLLIHELLHLLGLEFCFSFQNNEYSHYDEWINDWFISFNLKKNHSVRNLYEGICNTSTNYFLSIYNSIYLNHITHNNKLVKYFCYFFYLEFVHSLIQTIKLLKGYNINNYKQLVNNNNDIYHQISLMFEYIVLRFYIVNDYYRLLLYKMLKSNFNTGSKQENEHFQNNLNSNTLRLINVKNLETLFNNISNNINDIYSIDNNNYIEYFCC